MSDPTSVSSGALSTLPAADKFALQWRMKMLLWVRTAYPLAIIGIVLWGISDDGISLTATGPLILLGLAGLACWNIFQLIRWIKFEVVLSDAGIKVGKQYLRWDEIASAHAQTAAQFKTFIELTAKAGESAKIPAGVEQPNFILAVCEKHIPGLTKKV